MSAFHETHGKQPLALSKSNLLVTGNNQNILEVSMHFSHMLFIVHLHVGPRSLPFTVRAHSRVLAMAYGRAEAQDHRETSTPPNSDVLAQSASGSNHVVRSVRVPRDSPFHVRCSAPTRLRPGVPFSLPLPIPARAPVEPLRPPSLVTSPFSSRLTCAVERVCIGCVCTYVRVYRRTT
jgi:hypothetical protein